MDKKRFSEYDLHLSCLHADGRKDWRYCGKCGATCERDEEGKIVKYERPVSTKELD